MLKTALHMMPNRLKLLVSIALMTLAVALYFILGFGRGGGQEKTIVFVGRQPHYEASDDEKTRLKKDHDQFHLTALRYYLDQMIELPDGSSFNVEYRYNSEDYRRSESIYSSIGEDESVVLVVDNTWGQELQPAADEIHRLEIPVISLNADKGGEDFGPGSVFLGADDDTPENLVDFLLQVIGHDEVTFITEEYYKLKDKFREEFQRSNVTYFEPVTLPGNQPPPEGSERLEEIFGTLNEYFEDPLARQRPIILNVHGEWGSRLINELDSNFSDLTIVAGGSAVNEDFDTSFGLKHGSNQFFVLFFTSEDSMSEGVYEGLKRFRGDFGEYVEARNVALFLDRIQNAVSLIKFAVEGRSSELSEPADGKSEDDGNIDRAVFLDYFANVRGSCVETEYDVMLFNDEAVQGREINFVRYQGGQANSHSEQLNTQGKKIPNIRMGIQVTNVFGINLREGEFGVDFFYWTESQNSSISDGDAEILSDKTVIFKNLKELSLADQPVVIRRGDEVYRLHRLSGRFYTQFNIRDYPLDEQHLRLQAEVINPSELVRLSFDRGSLKQAEVASGAVKVDEWNIEDFYVTVDNKMSGSLYGRKFSEGCGQKFKQLTAHIVIERNFWDSFLTVVLPLVLIGLVAISILWVGDQSFHSVGSVAVGIFLGLIAFLIALTDIAPDLSQISLGGVLFWATFTVVIAVILVLVVVNSDLISDVHSLMVQKLARVVIPLIYLMVVFAIPFL